MCRYLLQLYLLPGSMRLCSITVHLCLPQTCCLPRACLPAPSPVPTRPPCPPAVMRFARATGDAHALSSVDVRLLALAHTLEVQYYGSGHLREQPPPPRLAKKKTRDSKHLPGWGAEGGDWAELDKLNEEELAAAEAALMAGAWVRKLWHRLGERARNLQGWHGRLQLGRPLRQGRLRERWRVGKR
jgi:hypothetical protein